jgi:enoyl-CoA hydratase / long-chain 3-hydroxyacyl-CoA dehydrogenase
MQRFVRNIGPIDRVYRKRSSSCRARWLSTRQFKYFDNFEVKDDVAIIRLNGPNKMNTLSEGMTTEVQQLMNEHVKPNKNIKAIVFLSSKADNFIAGADIDMIKNHAQDPSKIKEITMNGHKLFDEIKKLNLPLVAGINGACLGGGLEWALYCDYRIATTSSKTVVGFPEVKLGLLPGMAGTYHLPLLAGYATALDMILTGKNVRPDKAKKLGIVDLVVDPASLESVAITQAKGLAAGTVKKYRRKKDIMSYLLEDTPIGRNIMFKKAKDTVDKNSGGHYPAPYKILDVLQSNYGKSKAVHLNDESDKFVELAQTKVSEALIGIFHGTTAVKKHDYGTPKNPVKSIAVLGAGLMGAGIAQVSLDNGKYRVLLKDKDQAGVSRGEKVITDALEGKVKKKSMTNYQFCEATSRLIPLHDGSESWKRHFSQADLVIEAVFEEISVKHKVLKEMEDILPAHAIFASNTSAIPIAKIAEGSKRPAQVIGMHYFSPVPMMPLLEIINHPGTAPEVRCDVQVDDYCLMHDGCCCIVGVSRSYGSRK